MQLLTDWFRRQRKYSAIEPLRAQASTIQVQVYNFAAACLESACVPDAINLVTRHSQLLAQTDSVKPSDIGERKYWATHWESGTQTDPKCWQAWMMAAPGSHR